MDVKKKRKSFFFLYFAINLKKKKNISQEAIEVVVRQGHVNEDDKHFDHHVDRC